MRIGSKLIFGFLMVALLTAVVGYVAVSSGQKVKKSHDKVVHDTIPEIMALEKIRIGCFRMMMEAINAAAIEADEKFTAEEEKEFLEAKEEIEKWEVEYAKHVAPDDTIELQFIEEIDIAEERIGELGVEIIALKKNGGSSEEILEKIKELGEAEESFLELIDEVEAHEKEELTEENKILHQDFRNSKNTVYGVTGLVFLLSIGLGLFITKTVSNPIIKIKAAAAEIGKGKLDTKIEIKTKDEIGELAASFNDMAGKLKESQLKLKESHKQLEEKVKERTVKLSSANVELEDEIEQRSSAQKTLEERIKELNCLFGLSKLVERPEISLEQIFEKTVHLIRKAYQYPDATCVRITFEGVQHKTDNFEKSESSQHAQIKIHGDKAGDIEVYYLGEKAESGQSPFLTEEHDLLDAVAKHLGSVAERKKIGEKLQLFRSLVDQSNDSVFVVEPEWGRFLDVSDRACNCLGYTREELLQMSVKDIDETIPDDSAWTQNVKEVRQKGYVGLEGRYKRKDGTTFFVETSLKLVSQGDGEHIIAVARDITERKQAEEKQAELLEKVESINKELKDFAYIISHDLKAPLRGIRTLADWIGSDYADKLDDEGREQMGLLSSRVDRMHNLVDGVLEYSRVGREKEKQVQVNLGELVPEIIDVIAPPENIVITVEKELPVVECGQTRIMQVFQNLLSNAVKYMDKPKGRVKVGCVEEDGFWKFSVADNGPGIKEKHFERIFQIFQTLSPRDEFESTGVGLTVVKKIVELYGGKIWVESKPGEGSTFFFTLPKQEMGVKDAKLEANIAR